MIDLPVSLLPDPSLLELAVSLTSAEQRPLPSHLLKTLHDPWECPMAFLPLLARALSVDLWDEDWPEAKKRSVVARAKAHHRAKGSEWLHGEYLELVGAKLLNYTAAPVGFYATPSWTHAERRAWLDQFQQIRIYPNAQVTIPAGGIYPTRESVDAACFAGKMAPTSLDGDLRSKLREVRLYDPWTDTETVLTRHEKRIDVADIGTVYEHEDIVLPISPPGFAAGDYNRKLFASIGSRERVIRAYIPRPGEIAVSQDQWSAVTPDGRLTSIYPELVRDTFISDMPFAGHMVPGFSAQPDPSWRHIYERFFVFDRTRDRGRSASRPASYAGDRIGIAAFTAEIKVEAPRRMHAYHFVAGDPPGHAPIPHDTGLSDVLRAVNAAKGLRDRVLIDIQTWRTIRFSDNPSLIEGFRFSQLVRA
ncbi:MAG: phage tail protein I [Fulvimarina manganoxydans]|uniref:phage tail protein I n=1 Tax=Fulvimarina manganoxydans TaxID=937218 RepID=UPI0023558180|nr:phage tail protein I [Fulvimarina manganoxydans]MCK5934495.1 phage tail protein I [Fulvimarina manganoxydans]